MANTLFLVDVARRNRSVVLSTLTRLREGDTHPKTLHRLRTHLRRLQAYAELLGETANAKMIAECVSYFSPLRTLDVLEAYLLRHFAQPSDLTKVRKRKAVKRKKLRRNEVYPQVEGLVTCYAVPPMPSNPTWLATRMVHCRQVNSKMLCELAVAAAEEKNRKALHLLRLKIKSVRYQEEWVVREPYGRPDMVDWLKHAQKILGEYEERGQFRKLARRLSLDSREQIERDWNRTRKRAHALPAELLEQLPHLVERHLRLVKSERELRQLQA